MSEAEKENLTGNEDEIEHKQKINEDLEDDNLDHEEGGGDIDEADSPKSEGEGNNFQGKIN